MGREAWGRTVRSVGGEGRGGIGKYATCVMRQQDTHSREGKEEGKLKHYKTARAEPRTRPREVLY